MPVSDDEVKRLDSFLESHLYTDAKDNPMDGMRDTRDLLKPSQHVQQLASEMMIYALIEGPRDTIIMALINGFYWGRQFEKTEQLRAMYIGKEDKP